MTNIIQQGKRYMEVVAPVPMEHEREVVRKVRGVTYINNASGNSVNRLWYAIESIDTEDGILITQDDSETIYNREFLRSIVSKKVKTMICIGNSNNNIHRSVLGVVNAIISVVSINEAVSIAYKFAKPDTAVLYSPICNVPEYEKQGRIFKRTVYDLSF